ncbi:MAG TPA: DUF58 domain-containing protein [Polyangiaceae bacterium]
MQLHPTRQTFHVAIAGAGLVALGAAARLAPVVAFGGAMLLAVAIGRAVALVAVTRLRAAGFEMVWAGSQRVYRAPRGGSIVLHAELRNRGGDAVRGVALRPLVSGMLDANLEPKVIDLPGGARATIDLTVRAPRVGRWGVHGLALEVRGTPLGGEGLYEVPLLFANPMGVEVLPPALAAMLSSARGGRSRHTSELGKAANLPGEGDEMRELRDHVAGDPFKRIAWKASARRGRLLVRAMEREERDVVWLVLDASVELWAGAPGESPLDHAIDELGATAARHLRRGDRVGIVVAASRLRSWIAPSRGPAHAAVLGAALASAASCIDADRSELDEAEVAQRVAEHARPLDVRGLGDLRRGDLDGLAARADLLRARAPFAPRVPFAHTPREQALRHYLAAFGIESPPRVDGERDKAETTLAQVLDKLATEKPRASIVHVWAPAPARAETSAAAIAALRRRRIEVRWTLPAYDAGVGSDTERRSPVAGVVDDAVRLRARATRSRGERMLRRLGVRVIMRGARRVVPHDRPPASDDGVGAAQ